MNNSKNPLFLENLLCWKSHDLYIQLIKKCINDDTDGSQFKKIFFKVWTNDRDKERTSSLKNLANSIERTKLINNEKLIELKPFSTLMSKLFMDYDCFEADLRLQDAKDVSQEELKIRVKNTLLQIENFDSV